MKKILFLAAVLVALSVSAKDVMVARKGQNSLTLQDQPCGKEVAALLKPEVVVKFRAAIDRTNGEVFQACWILDDRENIFILYEDGDRAMVPVTVFKRSDKPAKDSI